MSFLENTIQALSGIETRPRIVTNIGQIIIVHKDLCRKIVKFSWLVLCNDCSLRIRNLNEKLVIEVSNIYFMIVKVWEDLDIV